MEHVPTFVALANLAVALALVGERLLRKGGGDAQRLTTCENEVQTLRNHRHWADGELSKMQSAIARLEERSRIPPEQRLEQYTTSWGEAEHRRQQGQGHRRRHDRS